MRPISLFETGARVRKPAGSYDPRTGVVCRENVDGENLVGVLWDGGNGSIIAFPPEYVFEDAS